MIPAEFANRVDDLIHLPQGHAVHLPVEFVEVFFDLLVMVRVILVVTLVEHDQDRLTIAVVRRVLFYVCLQGFNELFHNITFLWGLGDVNSAWRRFQVSVLTKFAQAIRPLWDHR